MMSDERIAEILMNAARYGRHVRIGPKTAKRLAEVLDASRDRSRRVEPETFTFAIETWTPNDQILETLARLNNFRLANAAFQVALTERPKDYITLRNKGMVHQERRPEGWPPRRSIKPRSEGG